MTARPLALIALATALATALACASARSTSTSTSTSTATSAAKATANSTAGAAVARGMDAAEVRRRLGAPQRVEQVPSAAVHGTRYERWSYGAREVVLVDGKVIDLYP